MAQKYKCLRCGSSVESSMGYPGPKLEMAFILGLQLRTVPTLTVAKIVSVSIPWSEAKKNFEWTDVGQGEAYPEPTS
jgi:hypothetical protein